MNLQQLEHFLVLVETQSFSRAAAKLHLTQPALSRSIQALEETLGGRLLERDKGKTLTALGELAIVRARRIRVELAELRRSASLLADYAGGTLRLGLGPTPTAILSLPLLREMKERYPAIKLLLSGGTPEMQVQELREGAVDALVVHRNHIPADADLHLRFFPRTPLGFVVRAGHPLAGRHALDFDALRRYAVAASGRAISDEVMHRLNAYFGPPVHFIDAIQYQSNDIQALVDLVRTTDTVFFGVLQVAQPAIARGELVQMELRPELALSSQFVFVTLEGKTLPPALLRLGELCMQYLSGPLDPHSG
ncbi:LysR family transcriptional regulator [Bordetella genomosp. 5]|uniref:LysR family transcriptional regulator n=1 Tax=Bordetella genomosp. 5 TaxID=1395608 RepID=A0A261TBR9_9BORD|nr:LysR family transcriptional regulator [Bordetella genomosp. 5]OZI40093.1 LysR family transcriptional regulator [Bordetella genomosp. 5]OZI46855.1 LysR family transcriptional regulator [Bordetella genomosp. 5]